MYLLDTNIFLIYSRENAASRALERSYGLLSNPTELFVSIVSLGEIDATIKKFNLGPRRSAVIEGLLSSATTTGIAFNEVVSAYGDIDAYSQGKLPNRGPFTARNMGKNDLWIAATAHVYELTLLTADRDFDHLAGSYLDVEYVDLSKIT